MELKDIYALWDRFEKGAVTEFELDYQGVHLKMGKGTAAVKSAAADPSLVPTELVPQTAAESAAKDERKQIKAPLVGVFYKAPAPGETPFVTPGQSIKKGDVIGIIEAMKAMNEITAPEDGIVEEVVAEDAQMVQYDEPLLFYR